MKYNESNTIYGSTCTFQNTSCSRVAEEDITDFTLDEDFGDDFFDDDDDMSIMSDFSNPRCDLSEHASSSSLMSFRSTTKKSLHPSTRRKSFSGRPSHGGDDSFRRCFSKRLSLGDDRGSFSQRRLSQGDDSFTDTVFSLLEERAFQTLEQMQRSSAEKPPQIEIGTSVQQLVNTSRPDQESNLRAIQGDDLDHLTGS